jgi:transcriptional regulator with XRE-family HTH domain
MAYVNSFLKRAIQEAGHTVESIAEKIGVNPRTVARWVVGERVPHPRHRVAMATVLGRDVYDLWPELRPQPDWMRPWIEVEREASVIRSFQAMVVPGLLQTEAYARGAHVDVAARPGDG